MTTAKRTTWTSFILIALVAVIATLLQPAAAPAETRAPEAALAQGDPVSVILRRDLNGYAGVQDAYLDIYNPNSNYWNGGLKIKYDGSYRAVISYDVSSLPANAVIDSAELWLHVYGTTAADRTLTVSAYRLLRAWDERTVTYNSPWATPGATGATDSVPAAVGSANAGAVGTWTKINVKSAVQTWVVDPGANYGLLLNGTGNAVTYTFDGSELTASNRPELHITYHTEGTPPPTKTPTITPTPTQAPTLTPTPKAAISTALDGSCIFVPTNSGSNWAGKDLMLIWDGVPTAAKLTFKHSNNQANQHYKVKVNDLVVGTIDTVNYSGQCTAGTDATFWFDPSILNHDLNTVWISNEENPTDNWSARDIQLTIYGDVRQAQVNPITFKSTYDGYDQTGWVMVPTNYDGTKRPVIVGCHGRGAGADGRDPIAWWGNEANTRGWLIVGADYSNRYTAGPDVQADVIGALRYVLNNYAVDEERIYLAGVSFGGGVAATVGAKYPDLFAAVYEGKGPTNFADWFYDCNSYWQGLMNTEVQGYPWTNAFGYQTRSSVYMARNYKHLPLEISHGLDDTVVPVDHGQNLEAAVRAANPDYLGAFYYPGDHDVNPPMRDPAWMFAYFSQHTRRHNPPDVSIRTDGGSAERSTTSQYYWLTIEKPDYSYHKRWTDVDAAYDAAAGRITAVVSDTYALSVYFDLGMMGMDAGTIYTVEDVDRGTGGYSSSTVTPSGGKLKLAVAAGQHSFTIRRGTVQPSTSLHLTAAADTYIDSALPAAPQYSANKLWISATNSKAALLRFDTTGIPQGKAVKAARLTLWATWWKGQSSPEVSIFPLKRDWVATQATWNSAQTGVAWGTAGADNTTTDREANAAARFTLVQKTPVANTAYYVNVTDLVQGWVSNPGQNHGVIMKSLPTGYADFYLGSSRGAAALQPVLDVVYDDPTPTPQPSATPTATPTRTLTPSVTPSPTVGPTSTPTPTASTTPASTPTPTGTAAPAAVYGWVWQDSNENGLWDAGEQPLAGARVTLRFRASDGNVLIALGTRTTGVDGRYDFSTPLSGQFYVVETDPSGYGSSTSNNVSKVVNPGEAWRVDFGDYRMVVNYTNFVYLPWNGKQNAPQVDGEVQ